MGPSYGGRINAVCLHHRHFMGLQGQESIWQEYRCSASQDARKRGRFAAARGRAARGSARLWAGALLPAMAALR